MSADASISPSESRLCSISTPRVTSSVPVLDLLTAARTAAAIASMLFDMGPPASARHATQCEVEVTLQMTCSRYVVCCLLRPDDAWQSMFPAPLAAHERMCASLPVMLEK